MEMCKDLGIDVPQRVLDIGNAPLGTMPDHLHHRRMSNNSVAFTEKPSKELMELFVAMMRYEGEPGLVNLESANKRRPNVQGLNPCFRGDMRLLTADGYRTFKELDGQEVDVINYKGNISKGKVWSSGVKEVFEVKFTNRDSIFCTQDHRFMLTNGEECEAKDLKGREVALYPLTEAGAVVQSVKSTGKFEEVFDFSEPEFHWGVVEGVVAHNCAEILLDSKGVCNLTTINCMAFVEGEGLDVKGLKEAQRLSVRIGVRMLLPHLELEDWDVVHKRDMLLGCSLTGYQDMVSAVGLNKYEEEYLLGILRKTAQNEARKYCKELRIPEPLLVTTVKPEGCWTLDHTRTTDQGILFLDEMYQGIEELEGFKDIEGYSRDGLGITKVYGNDVKDILRVTLKNGRKLDITPTHPMAVNGEWVEAKDLKVGDIIDYALGKYNKKEHTQLKEVTIDEFRSDVRDYKTPSEINKDLAWLLGAYFANGSFTTNDSIKFHCQHYAIHEKVQRIWLEQFGVETTINKSSDRDSFTQDFRSTKIMKWLHENGLQKETNFNRLPLPIRTSSKEDIIAFIVGYADNGGCFHSNTFCLDSANEEFIRHIQEVGEAVGFSFSFIVNSKQSGYSDSHIYKAHLSRAFSDSSIFNIVNELSVKAVERPIKEGIVKSQNPYTVVGVEVIKDIKTYDIEVDKEHWYYQGGLKSHNTLSLVAGGVSPGIHVPHSQYYIRRIRISANTALAKAVKEIGWVVKPEVGYTDLESAPTWVVEFPVKGGNALVKADLTLEKQFEIYKRFQTYYTDHNTSNTMTVKEDEWAILADLILGNWDDYVGVSFLSYDDNSYQLMPYEEISEEEYKKMVEEMPSFDEEILAIYDLAEYTEEELAEMDCNDGACAIR